MQVKLLVVPNTDYTLNKHSCYSSQPNFQFFTEATQLVQILLLCASEILVPLLQGILTRTILY